MFRWFHKPVCISPRFRDSAKLLIYLNLQQNNVYNIQVFQAILLYLVINLLAHLEMDDNVSMFNPLKGRVVNWLHFAIQV